MIYEVEFKSRPVPGNLRGSLPQYREYTVRAQNVLEAEEKAFKRLQMDESVNNDWIKNAEVHQIVHSQ
jgi:hypothetical protein|tara:strand:+ start:52 stop:255 length:204 start_codon:yes stop_codon:yes gene_type:complete